jgi:endo-1,4-beta-xylanase
MPTFNNMITVWRNGTYTPVFDSGYRYTLSPYGSNGAEMVDVVNGSQTNGTVVQQWGTNGLDAQSFAIVANNDGSWRLAMKANTNKCVDEPTGQTANGTHLDIWDCNGGPNQGWTITPDVQTGAFFLKNRYSGRCLDENGGNTASGLPMQVWDCNGGSTQKFRIRAR